MLFTMQRYEFFSKSQHMANYVTYTTRCCLPCKGTNFLANHNRTIAVFSCIKMLFTMQRYEFFGKSQQSQLECLGNLRCCLPCKGTNFLANHNVNSATAFRMLMLFTMQRYEFFSKSQLHIAVVIVRAGCCLPCKGTNFLANHNCSSRYFYEYHDVVYHAKVRIF